MPRNSIQAAMDKFQADFDKQFGAGRLQLNDEITPVEVIPTGSLELDFATVIGGYPRGRISEVWGPEGVGKTTMMINGAVQAQQLFPDQLIGYIDMEQKFDWNWAKKLGLNKSRVAFVQPDTSEDVSDMLKTMIEKIPMSMIVVDSIGGMISKAEMEKDAEDVAHGGKAAMLITRMVKSSAVSARHNNVAIVIVNQVRANLNSPRASVKSAGPNALRHVTTMKLRFRGTNKDPLKTKINGLEERVGKTIAINVERLNIGPEGRTAEVTLINQASEKYGSVGVDRADEAASLGISRGIITGSGWYTFPDGEKMQGRPAVVAYLREHPLVIEDIRNKIVAGEAGFIDVEADGEINTSTGEFVGFRTLETDGAPDE